MAKTTRILKAVLEAEDRASPKISKLGNALKLLGGVAAAVGAYQLGKKLAGGMMHAAELAGIQEAAEVKLAQAIKNTGGSVSELLPKYRAMAARLQDMTGVGDEAILNYQAQLVALGKLSGEGLERATKAALDLAAAQGMDLKAAFDLIAKASAGYTATLSRYGIILDETLPKEQKFEAALKLIEDRFGGQAQAKLRTFSGRMQELKGRWSDFLEKLGGIVRTPVIQNAMHQLAESIKEFTKQLDSRKLNSIAVGVVDFSITIVEAFAKVGGALRNWWDSLNASFNAVAGFLSGGKHTYLGQAFYEQADEFRDKANEATLATRRWLASLKDLRKMLLSAPAQPMPETPAAPTGGGGPQLPPTDEDLDRLDRYREGHEVTVSAIELSWQQMINNWVDMGGAAFRAWIKYMRDAGAHIETLSEHLGKTLRTWAVGGAQMFADQLVNAAFEGKAAFKDFFKNLMKWLAAAIARALALRAVLSFLGGFAAPAVSATQAAQAFSQWMDIMGPVPFGRGGIARAAGGWLVPGYDTGQDSVPAVLRPGEAVLPRELTSLLMETALAGGGGGVEIHLHGSLPALVEEVSTGVRNGDYRLVATETATTRVVR